MLRDIYLRLMRADPARLNEPPVPAAEFALGAIYLLVALCSIRMTRATGGVALIWPANAIAAAALIRFRRLRMSSCLLIIATAAVASNVLGTNDGPRMEVAFALINTGEVALMAWVYRSLVRLPIPTLSVGDATHMTVIFGLAIPGLAAVFGGYSLHLAVGVPLADSILRWWLSDAIGACIFGPPIILVSSQALRRLWAPGFALRNCAMALMCLAFCYIAIRYIQFPFVVISVPLLVAALGIGGFGTAVLSLLCGLEVIGLWLSGIIPVGLESTVSAAALRQLPLWALISTLMPPVAVGLGSDARRRITRALRRSERRFRETLARSPIGAVIIDLKGTCTEANAALQDMLGYSQEELRSVPFATLSHPDDRADLEQRWEALRTERVDVYETERRLLHKNGAWVWTRAVVSLVKGEDDEPPHFIAQVESLESRRAAERALLNERELLKTALRAIGNAVITTDSLKRITYINAAARDFLGQTFAEIELRRFDEVVGLSEPNTSQAAPDMLGQCLALGQVVRRQSTYVLHRPDASASYVIMSVSPLFGSGNNVTGAVIVLQDSTERYEWERELTRQARYDAMTGLLNRAEFRRRKKRAFQRARLLGEPAALLAIDLDRFKAVNDAGGHAAGDAVLRNVAAMLKTVVRQTDAVARLGGDEFAIVLEQCHAERAAILARELLGALNPLTTHWNGSGYDVGASIGVAVVAPEMADEAAWLSAADQACYAAKRAGRGRFCNASETFGSVAVRNQQ